jgi:hypothetical protein
MNATIETDCVQRLRSAAMVSLAGATLRAGYRCLEASSGQIGPREPVGEQPEYLPDVECRWGEPRYLGAALQGAKYDF